MPITTEQLYNIISYIQMEIKFFWESNADNDLPEKEKKALLYRYIENDFQPKMDNDLDEISLIHAAINNIQSTFKISKITKEELAAVQRLAKLQFIFCLQELSSNSPAYSHHLQSKKEKLIEELKSDIKNHHHLAISAFTLQRHLAEFSSLELNKHIQYLMVALDKKKRPYLDRIQTFESLVTIMRQPPYQKLAKENANWMIRTHAQFIREHQQLPSRLQRFLQEHKHFIYFSLKIFAIFTPAVLTALYLSLENEKAITQHHLSMQSRQEDIERLKVLGYLLMTTTNDPSTLTKLNSDQQMLDGILETIQQPIKTDYVLPAIAGTYFGITVILSLLVCITAIYGVNYLRESIEKAPKPLPELFSKFTEENEADLTENQRQTFQY